MDLLLPWYFLLVNMFTYIKTLVFGGSVVNYAEALVVAQAALFRKVNVVLGSLSLNFD